MAKITLSNVASGYNRQNINTNFEDLAVELQDKVFYRDNPTGEPNQLEQELDMNGNVIANAKDIHTESLKLNGQRISANNLAILEADSILYDNTSSLLTATSIQDAIDEVEGRTDTAEDRLDDLGTAAVTDAADYATSAQGDTATVLCKAVISEPVFRLTVVYWTAQQLHTQLPNKLS